MAISSGICDSFNQERFLGTHVFGTDVMKLACYANSATIGPTTTAYTATGEISGTGYSAGGYTLTNVTVTKVGNVTYIDFDDVVVPNSTLTVRGAMLYNSSKSNKSVFVADAGVDVVTTNGTLTISPPAPGTSTAVIRSSS